jgi:hypothetical protein
VSSLSLSSYRILGYSLRANARMLNSFLRLMRGVKERLFRAALRKTWIFGL